MYISFIYPDASLEICYLGYYHNAKYLHLLSKIELYGWSRVFIICLGLRSYLKVLVF